MARICFRIFAASGTSPQMTTPSTWAFCSMRNCVEKSLITALEFHLEDRHMTQALGFVEELLYADARIAALRADHADPL